MDNLTAGPGITFGHELKASWHSITCVCHRCLMVDLHTIGPTMNYGYAWFSETKFDADNPSHEPVYRHMA